MLVQESPAMKRVVERCRRVAKSDVSVLVTGETGTGKDVLARLLHRHSGRPAHKFSSINCAGVAETLLDSELFGHEKGAYTGAHRSRPGIFEATDGGTVFLDELGDMPAAVQSKVLRVVEHRTVRRLGSNADNKVNVRLVAATNRDLSERMAAGLFRADLFWRLVVVQLHIPPLRERTEDIGPLLEHFLRREGMLRGRRYRIGSPAQSLLLAYCWPGNVRQLANAVAAACALARTSTLTEQDFPCLHEVGV